MSSTNKPLNSPIRIVWLAGLLVASWLLWSGLFKPLLLTLGLFSCLLTLFVAWRMDFFNNELLSLRFNFRFITYWFWLAVEVVKSSLQVARVVLHPALPISPRIFEIKADTDHPADQVLLANSITLTPGTLTMDLHNGVIKVHSLTREGADDLMAGEMARRVSQIRKGN
ncbi:MAG: Na+/H+ antiporter subunit E [Gammaproteobacteria bacterium]|nr:Na+/H+ antiporter subunit E [Gammaproteobacteria bacterium]